MNTPIRVDDVEADMQPVAKKVAQDPFAAKVAPDPVEAKVAQEPLALPEFMDLGMGPLKEIRQDIEDLHETLEDLSAISDRKIDRQVQRMSMELDAFAPAVTFIGQIKSGKTTLVNAVAGRPGLLPADVNPWTSVVTSVHLDHVRGEDDPVASFTFFDDGEWDHLIEKGGRIGELSERTGADKEQARIAKQIQQMREKTKARLGRRFEMLLGQTHNYNAIEDNLIQRYVCLGDDFDEDGTSGAQGQFADITKTAELHFEAPYLPLPLTLRDTPGMNDTFLMREQITISAIRESKVCVVVLSAHQALNTVDMGLIRLISNVKAKEVIIFVNRIDELADPVNEIPEIRAALKKTLRDKNGPTDPFIIFGSAYLANKALTDDVADMPKASVDSMTDYISMFSKGSMEQMDYRTRAWVLSGVPQLYTAIGDRIAQGPADRVLARVRRRAANIIESMRSVQNLVSLKANSDKIVKVEVEQVEDMIRAFSQKAHKRLDATLDELFGNFVQRIDQANDRYTARALEALIKHLEANGEDTAWSYSADGLRSLMRTAYQVMSSRFRKQVSLVFEETSQDITQAISQAFDVSHENFKVASPPMPELPAPVGLAQTIALDLNTSIWKRWWAKRKGYQAYASDFQALIEAETETMLNDLKGQQIDDVRRIAQDTMISFLEEQASLIIDICDRSQVELEDLHELFGVTSQDSLEKMFEILLDELNINDALEERD